MTVTRVPEFPESVIRRGEANARNDLNVYSRQEVDAEINALDLTPYALTSTVASISGGLDTRIDVLETTTQDISANFTIDINNLDISLTQSVVEYSVVDGSTPSVSATPFAWAKIAVISGGPMWIQVYK